MSEQEQRQEWPTWFAAIFGCPSKRSTPLMLEEVEIEGLIEDAGLCRKHGVVVHDWGSCELFELRGKNPYTCQNCVYYPGSGKTCSETGERVRARQPACDKFVYLDQCAYCKFFKKPRRKKGRVRR